MRGGEQSAWQQRHFLDKPISLVARNPETEIHALFVHRLPLKGPCAIAVAVDPQAQLRTDNNNILELFRGEKGAEQVGIIGTQLGDFSFPNQDGERISLSTQSRIPIVHSMESLN